jgi:hypothetical protein
MTFQEKFDQLRNNFALKSNVYLKSDATLTDVSGFGDVNSVPNYLKARNEFQEAGNEYHNFLIHFKDSGKEPNDEFM